MNKCKLNAIIIFILLAVGIVSTYLFFNTGKSMNLQNLKINGLSLAQDIEKANPDANIDIKTDEQGKIIQIIADADDHNQVTYNGRILKHRIEDIKNELGEGYKQKIYDYAQGFKEIEYLDKENGISFEIVYYMTDEGNRINWFILTSLK